MEYEFVVSKHMPTVLKLICKLCTFWYKLLRHVLYLLIYYYKVIICAFHMLGFTGLKAWINIVSF